jgi:hypothetical protein
MREIRTLRATWRGLETWNGRDTSADRRASPRPYRPACRWWWRGLTDVELQKATLGRATGGSARNLRAALPIANFSTNSPENIGQNMSDHRSKSEQVGVFDAVIVGAGFAGMYI